MISHLHMRKPGLRLFCLLTSIFIMLFSLSAIAGCSTASNEKGSRAESGDKKAPGCRLVVNGQEKEFDRQYVTEEGGELWLAARPILDSLGIPYYWDKDYRMLYIEYNRHCASFFASSNYYTVDTMEDVMPTEAKQIKGEMVLPARLCPGFMGATCKWDGESNTLAIDMPVPPDLTSLEAMVRSDCAIQTTVSASNNIGQILDQQCTAGVLPGMGGAIVYSDGRVYLAVSGVRKMGEKEAITRDDLWHMGSCTKAMTASMLAVLVENGRLSWNETMPAAFPEFSGMMDSEHSVISLDMLLAHAAGFPRDTDTAELYRNFTPGMTPAECRLLSSKQAATVSLEFPPGQGYLYSNLGYIVAASMAEQETGQNWEDLMDALLFKPLGISGVTYAGTGTVGKIDQPWPHDADRQPISTNGPFGDPVAMFMAPCGYVHISLGDWGKFIIDQMRGLRGEKALLSPESYQFLVSPGPGHPDYGHGWMLLPPASDGTACYTHSGSNSFNTSVVRMYPARGYAVLVTTNLGDTFGVPQETYPPVYNTCEQTADMLVALAESGDLQ